VIYSKYITYTMCDDTITPVLNEQVHCVSFYCMIIVSSNAIKMAKKNRSICF